MVSSWRKYMVIGLALAAAQGAALQAQQLEPMAARLLDDANAARRAMGRPPLRWDPALGLVALAHCLQMGASGRLEHRYPGEADLTERASQAGARFNLIAENLAMSWDPARIHSAWMNSPDHRRNLLNPEVDKVGIAVVEVRGEFYAVAEYVRAVPDLEQGDVETAFNQRLHANGLAILHDPSPARNLCDDDQKGPDALASPMPALVFHWQGSKLNDLPAELTRLLRSGQYRKAATGACAAHTNIAGFSQYRVAVLLY
jgi:hypothetical protein